MNRFLRYIIGKTWKPWLEWRLKKARIYSRKGIHILVPAGVFHPGYFFSTGFLLDHIETFPLRNKQLLELGCGSGLLSIVAAKKGAHVLASDISLTATTALTENAAKNNVQIAIIHSDLFNTIPAQQFDFILINPPYYKKDPVTEKDHAWYCGVNMEYFSRLFNGLKAFMGKESVAIMVLSEDCDIENIRLLCTQNSLKMVLVRERKHLFEKNFIYHISPV